MILKSKIKIYISIGIVILGSIIFISRSEIKLYFLSRHAVFWSDRAKIKFEDFQDNSDYKLKSNMMFYHGIHIKTYPLTKAYALSYFDKSKSKTRMDTANYNFSEELKFQKFAFDLIEVYTRKLNSKIDFVRNDKDLNIEQLIELRNTVFLEYKTKRDSIFNDKSKSNEQIIKYWQPKLNKMLRK